MRPFFAFVPVALVALTIISFSWIFGGTLPQMLLWPIPWVMALCLEALLFLPQRHMGETQYEARARCWKGLARDPLTWISLMFLLILTVPFFNKAFCLDCEYDAVFQKFLQSEWATITDPIQYAPVFKELAEAPLPYSPKCYNIQEHLTVFMWFLPALIAMLATRHALTRRGKIALLETLSWNGAVLAVIGFSQMACDAPGPWWNPLYGQGSFFSTFGYANMAASFFVLMMALSIAIWRTRIEEVRMERRRRKAEMREEGTSDRTALWIKAHYALVPATLNFFGALGTLSRAGIIFASVLAALAFLYSVGALLTPPTSRERKLANIKGIAAYCVGAIIFAIAIAIFAPEGIDREFSKTNSVDVADRVTNRDEAYAKAAWAVFKDHIAWGVGGWGYRHACLDKFPDKMAQIFRNGGGSGWGNVHNDYLQFMCEHGIIGFGLIIAIFIALFWPLARKWHQLGRLVRFMKPENRPPHPRALYCLPPGAFWTLVGCLAVMIHALGDCPLRSPAVLTSLLVSLAAIDGFLPRED